MGHLCPMPLTGFANLDLCSTASALPGVGVLEYAPFEEVDLSAWQSAILQSEYNLQSSAGVADWYKLPYVVGAGSWTEDQQPSPQGDTFRVSINAFLPADSTAIRGELSRMRHHRYFVRITRNGYTLIIGTPQQPLKFQSRFESGSDSGDDRGHRVTFEGVLIKKSTGYIPVF